MKKKYLTMPKVSIVTICYNAQKDLKKTIESVKSLDYSNIEYIVIDGGSCDGTKDVLVQNQQWISEWVSEKDNGIYDAMNKGILRCSGEWIIFMNAGDVFHNRMVLQDVFSSHYNDNVGIIYGDVNLIFPNIGSILKCFKEINSNDLPFEICHQGVFTRTNFLKKELYDTSFKIMADLDSFSKIFKSNLSFSYVPVIIADFDIVGGVSSTKPLLSHKEMMRLKCVSPGTLEWSFSLFRACYKWLLLKCLPKSFYNNLRYRKLIKMRGYEEL